MLTNAKPKLHIKTFLMKSRNHFFIKSLWISSIPKGLEKRRNQSLKNIKSMPIYFIVSQLNALVFHCILKIPQKYIL